MLQFDITLCDLRFFAKHGVIEFERQAGNEFIVNLTVTIPYDERVEKDNLDATISYVDLFEIVSEEMAIPRGLLENVASSIVKRIKTRFPFVLSGHIRIEKRRPPIPSLIGSAAVVLNF